MDRRAHESMSYTISLVAPAYNEEGLIAEFLDKSIKAFHNHNLKGEILIVNDASTDKTKDILNKYAQKSKLVKVIHNQKNLGLTGASWIGFQRASSDIIVFLPSDLGSDPQEDIPILLKPFSEGYDMVVGWKQGKRENFVKQAISRSFNWFARLIFQVSYHDLGWIKAFKKEVIQEINLRSDWHRYFTIFAAKQGFKIKEVKTNYRPRKAGKSKFGVLGLVRIPGAFFDMISVKMILSFSKKPMFVFGLVGSLFIFIGAIVGFYLLVQKLAYGASLTSRTPLIFLATILLLSGIQLFAVGFLAELIATLREEVKRK